MVSRVVVAFWLVSIRLTVLVLSWNQAIMSGPNRPTTTTTSLPCPSSPPIVKHLLCIRHGISTANEYMSLPGNQWGDPNFRDEGHPDAPLSEMGRQQTRAFLNKQFTTSSSDNNNNNNNSLFQTLQQVELVLVSPLTRCLETFHYGVETYLPRREHNKTIPILALPLLRERVYTTSDTGRPASILAREFPTVDFSELPPDDQPWWYTTTTSTMGGGGTNDEEEWNEWRPHGENQWYGVPGEPEDVFEERMKTLDEWIANRSETTILLVTHWGVLRHLTEGMQFENAEAKVLVHSFCPIQRASTVSPL